MKRLLGVLLAMAMLLASMTEASALTFSAWEDEIPPLAVSKAVAEQIAEDTAGENGFQLNDVTLLHAATKLVKADDTGRPIWVVSRTYMENDTEQLHQYHAIIDAQTGEIQYDTKFYFEKMHDWESELQCDRDFWPYEKYYLFCHVYIPEYIPTAMPEESCLTLEEVRLVCDYRIREWSGFTLSQEELDAYTMTVRYSKALPHNSSATLAMPFPPSASCRNLDLHPVNLRFLQSHLTKNAFAIAPTHLCGIALRNLSTHMECGMLGTICLTQMNHGIIWNLHIK